MVILNRMTSIGCVKKGTVNGRLERWYLVQFRDEGRKMSIERFYV